MKTFKLPHGIEVTTHRSVNGISGCIVSNLRVLEMEEEDTAFNKAIDGIEALILAHACAGVDIESEAYQSGVKTAIESLSN